MIWPAFVHPWMLAGLAAAGLPVLIHFLTRARPRRIAFPPYQFLMEACAGQQSMHRLRTLLLLLLRVLAMVALALLFAGLLTFGLSQGDAGHVHENAENQCLS